MSEADIAQLRADLQARSYAFNAAETVAVLDSLRAGAQALRTELQAAKVEQDTVVQTLEADPNVADDVLDADAGGPYTAPEGQAITFDASQTRNAPRPQFARYEWDMDGDGEFDDATGVKPVYTFNHAFRGYVGVRVTNTALNRASIDYAPIDIQNVNSRPEITASSPLNQQLELDPGTAQQFQVAATDPDNDLIGVKWYLDGTEVQSDGAYTYHTDRGRPGPTRGAGARQRQSSARQRSLAGLADQRVGRRRRRRWLAQGPQRRLRRQRRSGQSQPQ
jgi:hypothetical protein